MNCNILFGNNGSRPNDHLVLHEGDTLRCSRLIDLLLQYRDTVECNRLIGLVPQHGDTMASQQGLGIGASWTPHGRCAAPANAKVPSIWRSTSVGSLTFDEWFLRLCPAIHRTFVTAIQHLKTRTLRRCPSGCSRP